jgi:hypothetical protein
VETISDSADCALSARQTLARLNGFYFAENLMRKLSWEKVSLPVLTVKISTQAQSDDSDKEKQFPPLSHSTQLASPVIKSSSTKLN